MKEPTKRDASDAARAADHDPARRRKQPYHTPVLVEYGSVAKLTKGNLSINVDGSSNNRKNKTCL